MNGNWSKLGFNIVFFSPDSLTKLQQKIQRQGKENDPGRSSKANSKTRKTVNEKTLSWSPAPAATGPCWAGKTRQSFLRNLLGRCAGLLEIKRLQNSGYRFLKNMGKRGKKRGGGGSLWSQVVAPVHARCVFYCFVIIVQLLLGRIYWNSQHGC